LATAIDTKWIEVFLYQQKMFFNSYFVLPSIAKVVFVEEALMDSKMKVAEPDLMRIGRKTNTTVLVNAVILAVNVESM